MARLSLNFDVVADITFLKPSVDTELAKKFVYIYIYCERQASCEISESDTVYYFFVSPLFFFFFALKMWGRCVCVERVVKFCLGYDRIEVL